MKKVVFTSSGGGHFHELMQLKTLFNEYEFFIITEKTKVSTNFKEIYENKIFFLKEGTRFEKFKYPFVFISNIILSFYFMLKIKPDVIVSTGAHTAVIVSYVGKLFGKKVIHIETYANSTYLSLTGKLMYRISDLFIVQWEELANKLEKAVYGGSIF